MISKFLFHVMNYIKEEEGLGSSPQIKSSVKFVRDDEKGKIELDNAWSVKFHPASFWHSLMLSVLC